MKAGDPSAWFAAIDWAIAIAWILCWRKGRMFAAMWFALAAVAIRIFTYGSYWWYFVPVCCAIWTFRKWRQNAVTEMTDAELAQWANAGRRDR